MHASTKYADRCHDGGNSFHPAEKIYLRIPLTMRRITVHPATTEIPGTDDREPRVAGGTLAQRSPTGVETMPMTSSQLRSQPPHQFSPEGSTIGGASRPDMTDASRHSSPPSLSPNLPSTGCETQWAHSLGSMHQHVYVAAWAQQTPTYLSTKACQNTPISSRCRTSKTIHRCRMTGG